MSHSESNAKPKDKDKLNLYLIGYSPDLKYLKRLLSQVKPIVKSVSFVCTDDKDDCLEAIKESEIPYQFERMIFPSREDFDFSKARNLAREMALKNDGWCFWLDCDDTIENPENIIQQMLLNPETKAFGLPYDVNERSGNLFKIRIHKDEWYWKNKVHEELLPTKIGEEQPTVLVLSDCPVKHAPDEDKSNHNFHISLLKKNIESAEADYSYIAKEYFNSLQNKEAIPYIKKAIAIHSYPHEIYNLWMMLGICYAVDDKNEEAKEAWLSGIPVAPYRKEAYYYLAELYGKLGNNENLHKGLGYICACNAQIDKGEPLQNMAIYKTLSYLLHSRYLQKFNKYKEALEMLNHIKEPCEEAEIIRNEIKDACSE